MFTAKEYAKMTLDELVSEEKKLKSQKTMIALFMGLSVGIAIWSASHNESFIVTISLLIFAILVGSRHSKNVKGIQAEISRRNSPS